MTLIKELNDWLEFMLNHNTREQQFILNVVRIKLKELAKKDLEEYQTKIKRKKTVLIQSNVSGLGFDFLKDLEEITKDDKIVEGD